MHSPTSCIHFFGLHRTVQLISIGSQSGCSTLWSGVIAELASYPGPTAFRAVGPGYEAIAEREARQLILQCGGRIWASATIN